MKIKHLRMAGRLGTFRLSGIIALGTCVGLAAPLAQSATGDLDPLFADFGRRAPIGQAGGTAQFVESLGPDGILVGGGDFDISGSWRHDVNGFCSLTASGVELRKPVGRRRRRAAAARPGRGG